jgi:AraC-like DNA-binding protein
MVPSTHASGPPHLTAVPTASGGIARKAYAQCVKAGINAGSLLRETGLTQNQINNGEIRIPVQSQVRFLDLAAQALNDRFLGFHLAQAFDLRELGLLFYVMASSDSLGDALQRVDRYSTITNEGVRLIHRVAHNVKIRFEYVGVPRHSDRHQIEFFLTTIIRMVRGLTSLRLSAQRITLTHLRDDHCEELERYLGCSVEFGSQSDEITFNKTIWTIPLPGADPYLNALLRKYCDEARSLREGRPPRMLQTSVENLIVPLLPHKKIRASDIASSLGLSRRTLARRLLSEGQSFAGVLHHLKRDLAKRYLKETAIPISTIAWLLGYTEVSSFTHAFKRWTGKTPSHTRLLRERHA